MVENSTGQLRLIRCARGYEDEVEAGSDFWQVMGERYGLKLDVVGGSLSNIPATGPLVVTANHPFGILDGLMIGNILSQTRGDFRILAHQVFRRAGDLERVILPVRFDESQAALQQNIATRKEALRYLASGGAVAVFPGATVSTSARLFSPPMDPAWRNFTARMIIKARATVVPVHFIGQNSRLFQIASHLHNNLRVALLIKEFRARIDRPVPVVIGEPVCPERLNELSKSPGEMMDFLRQTTYGLSPKPLRTLEYGFENEEKHRNGASPAKGKRHDGSRHL